MLGTLLLAGIVYAVIYCLAAAIIYGVWRGMGREDGFMAVFRMGGQAVTIAIAFTLWTAHESAVFLLVALTIKLTSPGPIFFRQRRCGPHGREFMMVKFRTMVKDAEKMQAELRPLNEVDGPVFKIENDPRSTALGRFLRKYSIDEMPQLWNVLKGEMSLVGPRPLAAREMRFCPAWRDVRLKVRPGITGLWQVSGRSKTSFHDWIRLDIEYVQEQSIFRDFQILFKTLSVVLRALGSF